MKNKAEMNSDYHHVHFVGIGGIGMSAIARVLSGLGYQVSGSDLYETSITRSLQNQGVTFYKGHASQNIEGADVVVVSSAVPSGNPEIVEAKSRHLPILQRAQMLDHLMNHRFGITVAGTHGKTTTTSMLALILEKAGKDPTVVIGGELNDLGTNAKVGKSQFLVAEADESDASFLKLFPRMAVVTNIDADVNLLSRAFASCHFDYEKTLTHVQEVFQRFLKRIPAKGFAVLGNDCAHVRKLIPALTCQKLTYGLRDDSELRAGNIELKGSASSFEVYLNSKPLGKISLQVPGEHNILNALGATGAALQLDIPFESIVDTLQNFRGVKRRFQIIGEAKNILLVDDYGHNPAKIEATLKAAKDGWGRRIIAVFQPHRYTRAKFLHSEFADAFRDADLLFVSEIFSAGEAPIPGVTGEALFTEIQKAHPEKVTHYCPTEVEMTQRILDVVKPGDMVITLGAGDIYKVGLRLHEALLRNGQVV